jgi:1,4-dihydroxy-2-naphthoate octaprenyltransferase
MSGNLTTGELQAGIAAGEIDTVIVAFADAQGRLVGKRVSQVLSTVFMLVPFATVFVLAPFYPVVWLSLLVLLVTLSATLIVWTYRTPRELIVALQLSSVASLAWSGFVLWAYVAA